MDDDDSQSLLHSPSERLGMRRGGSFGGSSSPIASSASSASGHQSHGGSSGVGVIRGSPPSMSPRDGLLALTGQGGARGTQNGLAKRVVLGVTVAVFLVLVADVTFGNSELTTKLKEAVSPPDRNGPPMTPQEACAAGRCWMCERKEKKWQLPERGVLASADESGCTYTFVEYRPSDWEKQWTDKIVSGEWHDKECPMLAEGDELKRSAELIRRNLDLMKIQEYPTADSGAVLDYPDKEQPDAWIKLYSRMVYKKKCADGESEVEQLIEPLIGICRDPLAICPQPEVERRYPELRLQEATDDGLEDPVQSKRHILLHPAAPLVQDGKLVDADSAARSFLVPDMLDAESTFSKIGTPLRRGRNILMDLGASMYMKSSYGSGAVGARWFVERTKAFGVKWDSIINFEARPMNRFGIFENMPPEIVSIYSFYNVPVDAKEGGLFNPWRILMDVATKDDYVVVKLDIDTPKVEIPLMQQAICNPEIAELIDELSFEHHVDTRWMERYWGRIPSTSMADSYKLFRQARELGIRMHSWP